MANIERYQLTPAWHVIDSHDAEDGIGRELAAANSAADGERIVRALNSYEGAVEALRKYGHHAAGCVHWPPRSGRGCDCGFDAALNHHRGQ